MDITEYNAAMLDKRLKLGLFERNLKLWMEMEQKSDYLTGEALIEKKRIIRDYVERLVSEGSVSTDVFKAELGPERTKNSFLKHFLGRTVIDE